jgi:hypothetical protein
MVAALEINNVNDGGSMRPTSIAQDLAIVAMLQRILPQLDLVSCPTQNLKHSR